MYTACYTPSSSLITLQNIYTTALCIMDVWAKQLVVILNGLFISRRRQRQRQPEPYVAWTFIILHPHGCSCTHLYIYVQSLYICSCAYKYIVCDCAIVRLHCVYMLWFQWFQFPILKYCDWRCISKLYLCLSLFSSPYPWIPFKRIANILYTNMIQQW